MTEGADGPAWPAREAKQQMSEDDEQLRVRVAPTTDHKKLKDAVGIIYPDDGSPSVLFLMASSSAPLLALILASPS